jgi:putative transposase
MPPAKTYYERHLPHWQPPGKELSVTWRLADSLPRLFWRSCKQPTDGRRFVEYDRALDAERYGPRWLREPRVAELMVQAFRHGEDVRQFYRLLAFVVMPNHVHLLLKANVPLQKITQSLKGFTAFQAHKVLGRRGEPFWQDESFDHWVRNPVELNKILHYIENNPVTAGLVPHPQDWPWSSAVFRKSYTAQAPQLSL